ncbi:DUF3592 domain-containing protein [Streptomyces beihaiensis]|uniref:DUF3592 domain-containing protein n=1 Tax=Streptomyces beihaiensis TaxID=2984495 RepID=A0ABT3TUX5_9ACTN|nr:DUF3592 domain-containing protein [Streptomyces beihaiensis]MCX3060842.1 DUF3592 domain-containing protein [Streptomyces beihaiensis]
MKGVKGRTGGRGVLWWIQWIFLAIGSVCLVVGLVLTGSSISYVTSAKHAKGTVISNDSVTTRETRGTGSKQHSYNKTMVYPVVRFTPDGGKPVEFRSSTGTNSPSYGLGDQVDVLYKADSPKDAKINSFLTLWLGPLVLGGIGLVFGGIGTGILIGRRRNGRAG